MFEENWTTAQIFERLSTQWVFAGMGSRVGLNYQSLAFMLKLFEIEDERGVFEKLYLMELSALAKLREREQSGSR